MALQDVFNTLLGLGADSQIIDVSKLKFNPYIITVDRRVTKIDYSKMLRAGVSGVVFEAGYLYDSAHVIVNRYRNPNLSSQVAAANSANVPYGLYAISRARSVSEAQQELSALLPILRRYPTVLGFWLRIEFSATITTNNQIINRYQDKLVEIGYTGQIGIYGTPTQLAKISWSRHQDSWLLWVDSHVGSVSTFEKMLDPTFFDYSGR